MAQGSFGPSGDEIPFDIRVNQQVPVGNLDWEEDDLVVTKRIPSGTGGDSDVTFLMGVGSGHKTYDLIVDGDDWDDFKALRQTIGTLTDWDETEYEDVLLERLQLPHQLPDGRRFVRATFRLTSGS